MTIQLMLSHPMPALLATSAAQIVSSISSTTLAKLWVPFFFLMFSWTKVTASCEVMQSQMPSHAQMMKSVSGAIFSTVMSGKAVIT